MEPSSTSTDPLKVFYDSLTKQIDDIERMLQSDTNENMSIQFLERILSLTRFCHDQMTHWALALKLPAGGNWCNEYIDESEKLMKASRDVKEGVERMPNYYDDCFALTEFLGTNRVLNLQTVQQMIVDITDCIQAAEAVEEDNIPLSTNWRDLRLTEVVVSETRLHECLGFNGVIYATRNVCKTLLLILLYGLVYCWPEYKFESYVYEGGLFFDSSFMVSTDKLQKTVESKIINKLTRPRGILWYEFWRSKVALDELLTEFERVFEDGGDVNLETEGRINEIVENLKRCVEVLEEGSKRIIEQIDDLTDEIIEARKKIYGLA